MKKLAVIALLAVAPAAFAGNLYVFGTVGQSRAELVEKSVNDSKLERAGKTNISSSLDETDTAYKLQLGYRFDKYLALEGGYFNLGKFGYSASYTGGSARVEATVDGWNIVGVGLLPLDAKYSLFGKMGAVYGKVKTEGSASGGGVTVAPPESARKWSPAWGLGISYDVNKHLGLRLEYEHFNDLGDKNKTGESDVSLISGGVALKF